MSAIDPSRQRRGVSSLIKVPQIRNIKQPSERDHVDPAAISKADIIRRIAPFNHNVLVEEPSNVVAIPQPTDIRPKDLTKRGLPSKAPRHSFTMGTNHYKRHNTLPRHDHKFKPDNGTVASKPILT